jgi:UDP-glucuronate decarboxylase
MARIAVDGFLSPFNLGNPTETTILELAKKIIFIREGKYSIIYRPFYSN